MRFRKKPVEVEAVRFGYSEYADDELVFEGELPRWLKEALGCGVITGVFRGEDHWYLMIETLEGPIFASPGDWIIRGVHGEIYPCKPDIFEATYEAVN